MVLVPIARAAAGPANSADQTHFETYVVRPGDTLWQVAQGHDVAEDPRSGVQILLRLNPDAASLQPGMTLRIPVD